MAGNQVSVKITGIDELTPKLKASTVALGVAMGNLATQGIAKVAHGITDTIKVAANFEASMNRLGAVSGASAGQMKQLQQAALDLGKSTKFSASEVASAESELAKAGVAVADILGGALKGSLSLAAAGNIELADAATVAAQAMNIFNLAGSDVEHIADVLAAGANKSAADVGQLGQAMQQAGLMANNAGLSLEETVGTLALFADNALIGSDAGTSLKTMLAALAAPSNEAAQAMAELGISAYDAKGNFIGISEFAGILQEKLGGLTQAQRDAALATIFGRDASRAALLLLEAGKGTVEEYTTAVNDSGAAARAAAANTAGAAGAWEQLQGAIETIQIEIGSKLLPVLTELALWVADNLPRAIEDFKAAWKPAFEAAAGPVKALWAELGKLLNLFEKDELVRSFAIALGLVVTAMVALAVATTVATGGLNLLIPAAIGLTTAAVYLIQNWKEAKRALEGFGSTGAFLRGIMGTLEGVFRGFAALLRGDWSNAWRHFANAGISAVETMVNAMAMQFDALIRVYNNTLAKLPGFPGAPEIGAINLPRFSTTDGGGGATQGEWQGPIDFGEPFAEAGAKAASAFNGAFASGVSGGGGGGGGGSEGIAEIAKTAAEEFAEAWKASLQEQQLETAFGETGAKIALTFQEALTNPTAARGLPDMVMQIIDDLKEEGVPNAQDLGDRLAAAIAEGLATGSGVALDVVLTEIAEKMKIGAVNAMDAFSEGFFGAQKDQAEEDRIGSIGVRFMADLAKGIEKATPAAMKAIGASAAGIVQQLKDKLPEGEAAFLATRFMEAVKKAIETKTPEAVAAVDKMFVDIQKVLEGGRVIISTGAIIAGEEIKHLTDLLKLSADDVVKNIDLIMKSGLGGILANTKNISEEMRKEIIRILTDLSNGIITAQAALEQLTRAAGAVGQAGSTGKGSGPGGSVSTNGGFRSPTAYEQLPPEDQFNEFKRVAPDSGVTVDDWMSMDQPTRNAAYNSTTGGAYDRQPLSSYAVGTSYVPRTGLALLHKGEAVIPAHMNRSGGLQVTIQALDARSFEDWLRRGGGDVLLRWASGQRAMV